MYNNVHSYSQLILLPWGWTYDTPDDYDWMFGIASKGFDIKLLLINFINNFPQVPKLYLILMERSTRLGAFPRCCTSPAESPMTGPRG